ncbi:polysaccharide deacetylase family protein [Arcicella sp. LKC2W]|uniref:polysaccharide deacetylase family protein n=1 Tax=Arcicella sp. LKC2W TaxID=2984198 RepID=UPI002B21BDFC|nr:polysaccharide deacetylase family protein [Arcicella sp. LKC2W]MEA5457446.1 polysaccharide deacetylase family protein [Arcicella sp. LKC2W]
MRALYPDFLWRIPTKEKEIYLTFDDGPIPEVTEFVMEELAKFNAKATFFCIGDNIAKHSEVFQQVVNQGHTVGNHTFNHLKGWNTEQNVYLNNFDLCQAEIENKSKQSTNFFRPPYGRIKRNQAKEILKTHQIVMWDVLTADYDQNINKEQVLKKTLQYTDDGSIVLFHDSIKASKNMMYALPRMLEYFSEQGYAFKKM